MNLESLSMYGGKRVTILPGSAPGRLMSKEPVSVYVDWFKLRVQWACRVVNN